jgi:hypothetical protein
VRVRPGSGLLRFSVEFHHDESRRVLETTHPSKSTLGKPKQRWVTRRRSVLDDSCSAELRGWFAAGAVYLLQYTYFGEGQCSALCLQQIPDPAGRDPATVPCSGGRDAK